MSILVTGFGPFGAVAHNPTAALARAVDGETVAGHTVHGVVLPVAYTASVQQTLALAKLHNARWVIGTGVAVRRARVTVERWGRRVEPTRPDVKGLCSMPPAGPERLGSTVNVGAFAQALGGSVSEDAGTYVCNAWLYGVLTGCPCPATFVHVPPHGLPAEVFLEALAQLTQGTLSGDYEAG